MIAIACSTRCFPLETGTGALARVAWAGFRDAEVFAAPEEELDVEAIGERLVAEELRLVALDAGRVGATSAEGVLAAMAHPGRCAVAAQKLGARWVILAPPPLAEATADDLAYGLSRLLAALGEVPVRFALRHAPDSQVENPDAFAELYRKVDAASVAGGSTKARLALALDPAAALLAGWDARSYARSALAAGAAAPLGHVYFTDAAHGKRVAPGSGEVDWPGLAAILDSGGYSGAVSLILEGTDPLFAESDAREAYALAREELFPEGEPVPGNGR